VPLPTPATLPVEGALLSLSHPTCFDGRRRPQKCRHRQSVDCPLVGPFDIDRQGLLLLMIGAWRRLTPSSEARRARHVRDRSGVSTSSSFSNCREESNHYLSKQEPRSAPEVMKKVRSVIVGQGTPTDVRSRDAATRNSENPKMQPRILLPRTENQPFVTRKVSVCTAVPSELAAVTTIL
jgi:hypothetical protein